MIDASPGGGHTKCNTFYGEDTSFRTILSKVAEADGGFAVSDLSATSELGQNQVFSPIIRSRPAHEILVGYPSAVMGFWPL